MRPASTVSFPVERPLKGKSVSGNAGNRDSINTNAFEKGGMDSALAGLGREKRSLQKGPPSPMPPCRFKRNGPYSFSGFRQLAEPQRVVVPDVLQRHVSGEHGPQRRGLSGCEGRHVDVHGRKTAISPAQQKCASRQICRSPSVPGLPEANTRISPVRASPRLHRTAMIATSFCPAL